MLNARKFLAIAALGIFLGGVVAESADARAGRSRSGGYSSFGARGSRTSETNGFQAIQKSRQPVTSPWNNPAKANPAMQNKQSWFQRNPFMAGLLGALGGMALFSMLGNMFGGLGGGFGGLLMLLLLGFLGFMAFRMLRNKQQPGYAASSPMGGSGLSHTDMPKPGAPSMFGASTAPTVTDIGGYRQTKEQGLAAMALNNPGFTTQKTEDELSGIFFRIQEAWSGNDRATLKQLTTDEIYDYFAEDLDGMAAQGERNVIKNIVMRDFDLSEAWTEGTREYITVKIYARLLDYVEKNGQIVEGSATEPSEFREVWTFARDRGEPTWKLSAINQV